MKRYVNNTKRKIVCSPFPTLFLSRSLSFPLFPAVCACVLVCVIIFNFIWSYFCIGISYCVCSLYTMKDFWVLTILFGSVLPVRSKGKFSRFKYDHAESEQEKYASRFLSLHASNCLNLNRFNRNHSFFFVENLKFYAWLVNFCIFKRYVIHNRVYSLISSKKNQIKTTKKWKLKPKVFIFIEIVF